MTKDEAARHKHWILLHAGGTPLQVWSAKDLCWYDSPNPSFRLNCIYRVKPVQTPEEKSFEDFRSAGFFQPGCKNVKQLNGGIHVRSAVGAHPADSKIGRAHV